MDNPSTKAKFQVLYLIFDEVDWCIIYLLHSNAGSTFVNLLRVVSQVEDKGAVRRPYEGHRMDAVLATCSHHVLVYHFV